MKRLIVSAALLALFSVAAPAFADATQQVIMGRASVANSDSETEYWGLAYYNPDEEFSLDDFAWEYDGVANEGTSFGDQAHSPFPVSGTLNNLVVSADGDSVSGGSYIVTINDNGTDSSVTCTLTGSSCSDTTHSLSVTVDDQVVIEVTPSGSPSDASLSWSVDFVPDTPGDTVWLSRLVNPGNDVESVYPVGASVSQDEAGGEDMYAYWGEDGAADQFYISQTTPMDAGTAFDFSFFGDGDGLFCTVDDSSVNGCSDTSNSATIDSSAGFNSAADLATAVDPESFSEAPQIFGEGMRFVPDLAGDFDLMFSAIADFVAVDDGDITYLPVTGAASLADSSGEFLTDPAPVEEVANAMTIIGISARGTAHHGFGVSNTGAVSIHLLDNGADTGIGCASDDGTGDNIGGSFSCFASGFSFAVAAGDLLSYEIVGGDEDNGYFAGGAPQAITLVATAPTPGGGGGGGGSPPGNNYFSLTGGLFRTVGGLFRIQ